MMLSESEYLEHTGLPPSDVQSTSAMMMLSESEYLSPSLSQSGFMDLQWPHQGARNLMKAALPEPNTSASKFLSVSSMAPALAPATHAARAAMARALRAMAAGGCAN